jgi:hypothetical protein
MRPLPRIGAHAILAGEVNSATEWAPPSLPPFVPTEFVPIAETVERKLEALRCYGGELRGPVRVDPARHAASDVGDEPLMLAGHLPVVVSRKRADGVPLARSRGRRASRAAG